MGLSAKRIILIITSALIILSGCSQLQQGGVLIDSSASPGAISQETVDLAESYVAIYEEYAKGMDFKQGDIGNPIDFSFGWLCKNGLIDRYLKEYEGSADRYYAVPQPVIEELSSLFFDTDIAPNNEQYSLNYGEDYDTGYPVELREKEREVNPQTGEIKLSYERYYNDMFLGTTVCYLFKAYTPKELPGLAAQLYGSGDTILCFISVTNQKSEQPYALGSEIVEISTPQELVEFAGAINAGDWLTNRRRYILTADLNMDGIEFTPIGTNGCLMDSWEWRDPTRAGFNGEFDGQGHVIRNLRVEAYVPEKERAMEIGLFAKIGPYGTVRNLTIENAEIISPTERMTDYGMSAGILAGSSIGTIENCYVSGTVTGRYQVGGLVGSTISGEGNQSSIKNCCANVKVYGHSEIGGLVGSLHRVEVRDCFAVGEVNAVFAENIQERPRAIAGFAGHSVAADVFNCISSVYVKTHVPSDWVGSFMGYNQGGVHDCKYDKDKSHWEAIDVIYPTQTDPGVYTDVKAVSNEEAMEIIGLMKQG